ncbi:MAG TPA: methyltransferase [Motiliproteus sp.]
MPKLYSLREHFQILDRHLSQQRDFWQLRPFANRELPWHTYPALRVWLEQLDLEACAALEQDDRARAAALAPFIDCATDLPRLCNLPEAALRAPSQPQTAHPARLSYHIPGRKWAQIDAFDRALQPAGNELLEWCAGKGHLGRLLAYRRQQPVTSLEWQHDLCTHGQQLADSLQLPCRMQQQDVLQPEAATWLGPQQHAVALHACGKLHQRLLTLGTERQLQAISLSPCCYHLIDDEQYQPLSDTVRQSSLRLSKQDLKLALQDTVTAGARERRLRQRELAWRLGFDLLQRDLRGEDNYLPCPTAPKSLLSGTFSTFCQWSAERKHLLLPADVDFSRYEAAGQARIIDVTRMELVRNLFRRPLELWLVLDRALYLEERGYQVTLSEFCDYQLTPRNLLIQGVRDDAPSSDAVHAQ